MKSDNTRILLRMSPLLHRSLVARAKDLDLSVNELCCESLSIPHGFFGVAYDDLRKAVLLAEKLFKKDLFGLVLYGSQARGEGRDSSDWDVLIVVSERLKVNRELYRSWDKMVPDFLSPIEVHFAQLPSATTVATGFWSEIAIDGIILCETELRVSRHLARVRREIAEGIITRKIAHGQSYWVHQGVA